MSNRLDYENFEIVSFNGGNKKGVNSIKSDEEENILKSIGFPDVILFQEIIFEENSLFQKDYSVFRKNRKSVLLKKTEFEKTLIGKYNDYAPFENFCTCAQTKHIPSGKILLILCVHLPKQDKKEVNVIKLDIMQFLSRIFEKKLHINFDEKRESDIILIGGDWNTNFLNYSPTKDKREKINFKHYMSKFNSFLITNPEINTTLHSSIDHIFCNYHQNPLKLLSSTTKSLGEKYDHKVLFSKFQIGEYKEIDESTNVDYVFAGSEKRIFYGIRGGQYYFTKSLNKVYFRNKKVFTAKTKSEIDSIVCPNEKFFK